MSRKRATIRVDWDKLQNTLVSHVVAANGQTVYSSPPILGDKTFAEARWVAVDWARCNGYDVCEKELLR